MEQGYLTVRPERRFLLTLRGAEAGDSYYAIVEYFQERTKVVREVLDRGLVCAPYRFGVFRRRGGGLARGESQPIGCVEGLREIVEIFRFGDRDVAKAVFQDPFRQYLAKWE